MKIKLITAFVFAMCAPLATHAAMPFVGTYQTIDDETNSPKSIVALYEYENGTALAGRIVALYGADGAITETIVSPVKTAEKVSGKPKYSGLDIIWDMAWNAKDNEYRGGKIMDPAKGKVYSSVIWQDADKTKLRVRGKIGPFGRTQTWNVLNANDLPAQLQNLNTDDWTPVVHK